MVEGLVVHRPPPPPRPLRLIGCEAAGPFAAILGGREPWTGRRAWLRPLDDTGRVMAEVHVNPRAATSTPSVLGGGLLDVGVPAACDLPGRAARAAWEIWQPGRPREPGLWRDLSEPAREAWLELTYWTLAPDRTDRTGGVHHLRGADVTDATGLHCALSDAIAGPGGYYGREWNAFKDCLSGGFGVAAPFTLIWHDFAASGLALAGDLDPATGRTYQEEIVDLLERRGVVVVRQ